MRLYISWLLAPVSVLDCPPASRTLSASTEVHHTYANGPRDGYCRHTASKYRVGSSGNVDKRFRKITRSRGCRACSVSRDESRFVYWLAVLDWTLLTNASLADDIEAAARQGMPWNLRQMGGKQLTMT